MVLKSECSLGLSFEGKRMSDNIKDDMRDMWEAINATARVANDLRVTAAEIKGTVERVDSQARAHFEDAAKHHYPPCRTLETLSIKLWGLLVLGVGALISAFWALLKG